MPDLRIRQIIDGLNDLGGMTPDHHALLTELVAVCLMASNKVASIRHTTDQGELLPLTPGAIRTRRYRERHKASPSVTSNVTVTDGGEKESPPDPQKKNNIYPQIATLSTPKQRGTRLPRDWHPSDAIWAKAKEKLGLSDEILRFETNSFRDHFWGVSGARGVKLDWEATWMNWMREAVRRRSRGGGAAKKSETAEGFNRAFSRIRAHAAATSNQE